MGATTEHKKHKECSWRTESDLQISKCITVISAMLIWDSSLLAAVFEVFIMWETTVGILHTYLILCLVTSEVSILQHVYLIPKDVYCCHKLRLATFRKAPTRWVLCFPPPARSQTATLAICSFLMALLKLATFFFFPKPYLEHFSGSQAIQVMFLSVSLEKVCVTTSPCGLFSVFRTVILFVCSLWDPFPPIGSKN